MSKSMEGADLFWQSSTVVNGITISNFDFMRLNIEFLGIYVIYTPIIWMSVIVHPHPNPPPSRGREYVNVINKYLPLPWWPPARRAYASERRGLGGGGAELLRMSKFLFREVGVNKSW